MESVPQEIVDEIIDNLPRSSLHSSSLVAKRWRTRSQQRTFCSISFCSEFAVNRWHQRTQSNLSGIPSYVKSTSFCDITKWEDPALFSSVLGNLNSLTTLEIDNTEIPDEVLEHISHGGFLNGVTTLHFWYMGSPLVIPMILAFPNLQNLVMYKFTVTSREPLLAHPVLLQRRPLATLRVFDCVGGVVEALVNLHLASRFLILDVQTEDVQKLLVLSLMTIVELELLGACSLCVNHKSINDDSVDFPRRAVSQLIDLPPLPALTSLKIFITGHDPSPRLISTLSSISSVPALASIALESWWEFPSEPNSTTWDHLNKWLSRMAENCTVEGGLVLIIKGRREKPVPDWFLPAFRKAGKIYTDSFCWIPVAEGSKVLPSNGLAVSRTSLTSFWLKE